MIAHNISLRDLCVTFNNHISCSKSFRPLARNSEFGMVHRQFEEPYNLRQGHNKHVLLFVQVLAHMNLAGEGGGVGKQSCLHLGGGKLCSSLATGLELLPFIF